MILGQVTKLRLSKQAPYIKAKLKSLQLSKQLSYI